MFSHVSILTIIGLVVLIGYYVGTGVRRCRLPSLIGYMLLGVVLGPSLAGWLDTDSLESLSFLTQIILGFVAFSIGSELSLASLRHQGWGIAAIIVTESVLAFSAVCGLILIVSGGDWPLALVFGAMAPASAPAGTVAVIQENRARGPLTKALYAVVGFDDGLAIIIYGLAAAVARSLLVAEETGEAAGVMSSLVVPFREIGLSVLVGVVIGLCFAFLVRHLDRPADILILLFGAVLFASGLAVTFHFSLILTNMFIGFILVNTHHEKDVERVTRQLVNIMPLMFILFFAMAGAHLRLAALPALGLIGLAYIVGRAAGLISGARIGAHIGGAKETIRKYLGLGILSQAGVAIGLALIVKHEFAMIGTPHADHIGAAVLTTITATCIFFEFIGPILTKFALHKAGEIREEEEPGQAP